MKLFRRSSASTLSPDEAFAASQRGELVLVDVRNPDEVRGSRVPGARLIPLGGLHTRLDELDADRRVGFICRSGSRSAMATSVARHAGVDAVNVKGGVLAWQRAGLPLSPR